MEALNYDEIIKGLAQNDQQSIELEIYQTLSSTNTYLLEKTLLSDTNICFAESQTAGRGRRGKEWVSPDKSNLYFSIARLFTMNSSALSGLSLVIGITVAETLQQYCEQKIGVKWPNDLLVDNKKLSGILIEIKNQNDGICKVVIGIGINIDMTSDEAESIDRPYINFKQCDLHKPLLQNELASNLLNNLLSTLEIFNNLGFKAFIEQWNALDVWLNKPVILTVGDKEIEGIHNGIDITGGLILNVDGERSIWTSGEVSLRKSEL
ncbi:MAG: BirA family biotin operon repressor/biotin-[acetyl-CoA-carboxylase] ligase [Enterobacterales bacterium]|jgi:BirA family biotin operon repressor/biotin-[acetyl-CoA-carboxylase] ligase